MPKYFVRMKQPDQLREFAASVLLRPERLTRFGRTAYLPKGKPNILIADLNDEESEAARNAGADLFADFKFNFFSSHRARSGLRRRRYWERAEPETRATAAPMLSTGLNDVLDHIKAPEAWALSRGAGVTIAIVDTGVCADLSEFPSEKRSSIDLATTYQGEHWEDDIGHGSMCASIAAATKTSGGKYDGVAPEATVLSARTSLYSTDIFAIYDELIERKVSGEISGPLVVSNSYGSYTCSEPYDLPDDHPYVQIVLDAIAAGITVVFAAGNNHYDVLCNHEPTKCSPTTIWGANSLEQVISVGTVDVNNSNQDASTPHANSSRGPGQWSGIHPKPDCVAPTYGNVVWGCGYQDMDWWGTSGACPQVAGLAALILSVNKTLAPAQVADIIRSACQPLSAGAHCVGAGLIDCAAAVSIACAPAASLLIGDPTLPAHEFLRRKKALLALTCR